jgi:D-threo-aldose 1-dehydrogenase
MDPTQRRKVGRTEVEVTTLSFGAAPIGNFIRPFTDREARAMVDQAWEQGVRYFDTAALYGHGLSEYRLGHALRERPREDYALSTKVGRVLHPAPRDSFDSGLWVDTPPMAAEYRYTYDGVMRSFEDALQRLMTDHVEIAFIHDVDRYTHGDAQEVMFTTAVEDGFKALVELRDQGAVRAIGFGVNEADVLAEAVRRTDSDAALLAGRYTLLEQDALDDLLPMCEDRGIGVVLGGVYNSGILATGPRQGAKFNYGPAPAEVLDRARRLEAVCHRHGVPLPAAAIQFAAAHPAVASVCIGSRTQEQQSGTARYLDMDISPQLWTDLHDEGLIREDAPTP